MRALRGTVALLLSATVGALATGPALANGPAPTRSEVVIAHAPPDTLDPTYVATGAGLDIANQMFDGLMRSDQRTGALTLELAQSYSASPDLKTWTFTLRPGLQWSDGTPLTAADTVFGIQRCLNAGPACALGNELGSRVASVTAPDPQTVQFQLPAPGAYLPALLTLPVARPLPQHTIAQFGSAWTAPANIVVSGAYTLVAQTATQISLRRNQLSPFRGHIERVIYDIGDPSQFGAAFVAGTVDYVDASLLGGVMAVEGNAALAPFLEISGPAMATQHLLYNAASGPTTDGRVRRALTEATDRAGLSAAVEGDAGFATRTFVAPRVFGAVPPSAGVGIGYDPAQAQADASAAGSAFPTAITLRTNCGQNRLRARTAAFLKSDWEDVFQPSVPGFTVNVDCVGIGALVNQISNPDPSVQAPVTLIAWAADWPDAANFMVDYAAASVRWSSTSQFAGFEADLRAAASSLDVPTRLAAYQDAERILDQDFIAMAPLFNNPDAFVHQARLTVVGDRVENWTLAR